MQELIWFSIPGFVLSAAIVTAWPSTFDSEPETILWVVLVPVIGFIIHQLYRLVFEATGGFARKSRKVMHHISEVLAPRENIAVPSLKKAFLVWEIVFYTDGFPTPFRDHNREAWHYILSFWSISFSATIYVLICLIGYFLQSPSGNLLWFVFAGEFIIALTFYLKGRSTYQSLIEQEIAVVYDNEEIFIRTLKNLKSMK